MSSNQPATARRPPLLRWRDGAIPTALILVGLVILFGLTRTNVIHYSQQHDLFYITAGLIALSVPGPIVRIWDIPGQLLLWNALGWGLGLVIFGMASIGATPILPLVLLGAALTFWPRTEDEPSPWLGATIALAGGFIACWVLWGNVYPDIPFTAV
ncbi:MAG TPA: hypothetical protein VNZ58_13955 [Thermomicrobiales bacterium]|nr:hypothetical protein [Thermomicrobiales bacterium]